MTIAVLVKTIYDPKLHLLVRGKTSNLTGKLAMCLVIKEENSPTCSFPPLFFSYRLEYRRR